MLVYNSQYDMMGILQEVNGKQLVKIQEDANIFMVYLEYTWEIVGEL